MEFKLIKEHTNGNRTTKYYQLGNYKICETDYGDNLPTVDVVIDKGDILFLPRIETIYDLEERIVNFKVNPSAYGSLSYEDIEVMINSLGIALETIEELTKRYVK